MTTTLTRERAVSAFKALRRLCKPAPLRGADIERFAVDRDDVEAPHRPTQRLIDELSAFGDDNPKLVLFGSVGSGKSTELARLDQQLGQTYLIVGLDPARSGFRQYGLDSMTTEGLVFLCGLAIISAAHHVWGVDLDTQREALESAVQSLVAADDPRRIDLGKLASSVALFGTTFIDPTGGAAAAVARGAVDLLSKTAGAVTAPVDLTGLIGVARQPGTVQALVDAVNRIIDAATRAGGRPPLLLIDETDKIDDPERSFSLLTRHGALLSLACPVVIAGPNSLLGTRSHELMQYGYQTGNQLYHVRVWQTDDPTQADPDGIAKMVEIIERRVVGACRVAEVEPTPLLTAASRALLAQMSGGVIRDLLGLVSEAARAAILDAAKPTQITIEHAGTAVAVRRREREVFQTAEHIDAMREVRRRRDLPGGPIVLDLLARNHVLMYSNDHPWYFPHALLLNLLDHHKP